ncbi:MAG: hypothetical protein K6E86_06825 [Bacteroidales bacterium]|nr:hypothetical protein [Bacteroidales bacterium]
MTITEFQASLDEAQIANLKSILDKQETVSDEDFASLRDYVQTSAKALGEDQITEPLRYICASMGGLRGTDLLAVIGEGFIPETFEQWNNLLGTPFFTYRKLPNCQLYDLPSTCRARFQKEISDNDMRSCASDLGYYMLEHLQPGDLVRDVQVTHMLLDGGETAAVSEYISQAEGEQLRIAVNTLAQALKDAPDAVKETAFDMLRCEGEKVNLPKLLLLMLADCYNMVQNIDAQRNIAQRVLDTTNQLIQQGRQDITVYVGIARLRLAQNARMRQQQDEAQQAFVGAMEYLMPPLQQADPLTLTKDQIGQYWIALKICQEMAQPKAISAIFESLIKVEQQQTQDTNRTDEERARIAQDIIDQHVDMAKLYYAFPKELQEQFVNYTEPAIALLRAFVQGDKQEDANTDKAAGLDTADTIRLAGYYQSLGELNLQLQHEDEAYDALVEAQILQMRLVGHYQKEEGDKMTPQSLLQRLALSVTNHMLAGIYRNRKSQHDLSVVLTANLNLALDCIKAFPRDGRVIHFATNAALELGDMQHRTGGLLAECGTYEKVISHFAVLNNMRIDGQLCQDIAMIHTRCGQAQTDDKIKRYTDGVRNLSVAQRLWTTLAQNTKNPEFSKNADFVASIIAKLKK